MPIRPTAAQPVVRTGESRANQIQYVSSHNSYQRADDIDEQLDRLNAWELELDVRWRENASCLGGSTDFYVLHHCADYAGEGWLDDYLREIAATNRIATGFFFLNIEDADGYTCLGCFEGPTFPSDWRRRLENDIAFHIGRSSIYTWADFVGDEYKWPSVQELIRRGKHVAISLSGAPPDETFFFARNSGQGTNSPIVIWNNSSIQNWGPVGDRYMTRRYLPASQSPSCDLESKDETIAAIEYGVNFPATNCLGDTYAGYTSYFQPPLPLYVSRAGASASSGRGTYRDPVVGPSPGAALKRGISLVDAFEATTGKKSLIEVLIPAGGYDLAGGGGPYTIDAAVKLTNAGGVVELR